ncbi:hypothetical protein [Algoriphagus litoralis]|uniref:hypothetical protein n=1 Tax=Algoriphagus litoralis TaxID=2202829 RepID=UPI00130021D5|nr:hypothetical protein [Algoriphagus litoralis]
MHYQFTSASSTAFVILFGKVETDTFTNLDSQTVEKRGGKCTGYNNSYLQWLGDV